MSGCNFKSILKDILGSWKPGCGAVPVLFLYSGLFYFIYLFFFAEEDLFWANICCQSSSIVYVGPCLSMVVDEWCRCMAGNWTWATEVEGAELNH